MPERQPGRQRVRHRRRRLPRVAQEPPAQRGLGRPSAPTSTATGASAGAAAAAPAASSRSRPTAAPPRSRRPRPRCCATSSSAAWSAASSSSAPSIDFHAFSELVLWPYGHTRADIDHGHDADDSDTFAALGTSMARTNRYTPEQSSDLYITDGAIDDWLWGANGIFAFTFEMYPLGPRHPASTRPTRRSPARRAATARPSCCCSRTRPARTPRSARPPGTAPARR